MCIPHRAIKLWQIFPLGPMSYLHPALYIDETPSMGRGVFTRKALKAGVLIEVAPVIVMTAQERFLIDQTLLHDYIFEWGDDRKECCMALGWVAQYNHAYQSNCEYEMYFSQRLIGIKTVRAISAGEELFINYNGEWNSEERVWFHHK
jgi:SET domain-containing protein